MYSGVYKERYIGFGSRAWFDSSPILPRWPWESCPRTDVFLLLFIRCLSVLWDSSCSGTWGWCPGSSACAQKCFGRCPSPPSPSHVNRSILNQMMTAMTSLLMMLMKKKVVKTMVQVMMSLTMKYRWCWFWFWWRWCWCWRQSPDLEWLCSFVYLPWSALVSGGLQSSWRWYMLMMMILMMMMMNM